MKGYPKIETLYDRDKASFKVTNKLRMKEFGLVDRWHVTEKIHGTNIRIQWDGVEVKFAARSSENTSDIHGDLLALLQKTFTVEKMTAAFGTVFLTEEDVVTLYGEGCGPGIQKGGNNYSATKIFVLFDVLVGRYWLEPENISDVAEQFGIQEAPHMGEFSLGQITDLVRAGFSSILAKENTGADYASEGIIARTVPGLMTRYGTRLMFKLKTEDFAK